MSRDLNRAPQEHDQPTGGTANPKHIPKDSQLAKDLQKTPGHMEWLGMDLAKRAGADLACGMHP